MSKISGPSWSSSRSLERQKKFVAFQKKTLCRFEIRPTVSKLSGHAMYLPPMLLQMILPAKSVTRSSWTAIEITLEGFDPSMTRPLVSVKLILSGIRMPASKHVAIKAGWPSRMSDLDPKEDGENVHSTSSSLYIIRLARSRNIPEIVVRNGIIPAFMH
jgi:hypothetical protein